MCYISQGIKPHGNTDRYELTDDKCRNGKSEFSVIAEIIESKAYDKQRSDLEIVRCFFLVITVKDALYYIGLILNTVHHQTLVDRCVVGILKAGRIRSDQNELACIIRRINITVDQHAEIDAVIEISRLCSKGNKILSS